jgi:hypothetical protein
MDAPTLLAFAGIVAAAGINVGGCLVAWGALKGAVAALTGRVAALEVETKAMEELKLDVARLEVRLVAVIEQLKDLNAQIRDAQLRWLRDPPAAVAPAARRAARRTAVTQSESA